VCSFGRQCASSRSRAQSRRENQVAAVDDEHVAGAKRKLAIMKKPVGVTSLDGLIKRMVDQREPV
jgi:hypothetical protein